MKIKKLISPLLTMVLGAFTMESQAIEAPSWYVDKSPEDSIEFLGLEWLTWDKTVGMTVNEAFENYGRDGWTLASNIEMAALFNMFFLDDDVSIYVREQGGPVGWDRYVTEFSSQESLRQWGFDATTSTMAADFMNFFGITDSGCRFYGEEYDCDYWTSAFYGRDEDNDGLYNLARYNYHSIALEDNGNYPIGFDDEYSLLSSDDYRGDYSQPSIGVALVRPIVTAVPEIDAKSTFLGLFLISGIILLLRERSKAQKHPGDIRLFF